MGEAKKLLSGVAFSNDAYGTMEGADAVVLLTEWNQFRNLDLDRMTKLLRNPTIVDLRNIYSPSYMKSAGFNYSCIGRP